MAEKCSCSCIECSEKLKELEESLKRLEIERDTAVEVTESFNTENIDLEDKVRNLEKQIVSLQNKVAEQQRHIEQYHHQT